MMAMKATPTTEPITMPAMAPPERLLPEDDPLWSVAADPEDAVGVGVASGSVTLKQGIV